jgi:type IV/VI secretion system ImpK/VasF family protein
MVDLVELRSKLRTRLENLRSLISGQHSEREAYFVLFPLIAHCDELIRHQLLESKNLEWPPLQQELYQVVDGGDLFFELLDNVLGKPETLPLIYEVYYFCLKDGFCGRYTGKSDSLADYMQRLSQRIRVPSIENQSLIIPKRKIGRYFRLSAYFYYIGVVILLMAVYFFLTFIASFWQISN